MPDPCPVTPRRLLALTLFLGTGGISAQQTSTVGDSTRASLLQATVVTATRSAQTVQSVPASVAVFDLRAIERSTARSVADFLRVIPGFSLRDFQSSLIAHPSRHAPAMRGLGGSSSSRVLVLLDGMPVNDPFAGWVHWSRVPMTLLARAEEVRGGGSGVWGDRALGGVINLMTVEPRRNDLQLSVSGGSHGTARTGGSATLRREKLSLQLAGDYTTTDGYVVVRPDLRGPIDTPAGARDIVGYARARYDFTPLRSIYLSANVLDEQRDNATPLRVNDTDAHEVRGGMQWVTADGSRFAANLFTNSLTHQHFFTSEALDRSSETPSLNQHTPARSTGAQASWSRQLLARHQLSVGVDASVIEGAVNEDLSYVNGAFSRHRLVEGKQSLWGVYAQDLIEMSNRVRLVASLRLDTRDTHDSRRQERDLVNPRVLLDTTYGQQTESRLSHSLGLRVQATDALSLRFNSYTAFRSPTLNELYKPFRESGNVITEANPSLDTERLLGFEGGLDLSMGRTTARLTVFHTRVHDPIFELTVEAAGGSGRTIAPCGFVPAGGTCRQRRNVDLMESRGIETEIEVRLTGDLTVSGSYGYNPTEVLRAASQPELVGKESRANARHNYTLITAYDRPSVGSAALTVRSAGRRFEDDLNQLDLESFVVADLQVSRRLTTQAQVFAGVENLFDAEYPVSRANTGLVRVGGPRMIEGGIRYRW